MPRLLGPSPGSLEVVEADLAAHVADMAVHSSGREIDYAETVVSPATVTSTPKDQANLEVEIPAGSRPVYVTASCVVSQTGSASLPSVYLTKYPIGAAADAGTGVQLNQRFYNVANGGFASYNLSARIASGDRNCLVRVRLSVAAGSAGLFAVAGCPAQIWAEEK